MNIFINGFGRIGRMVLRSLIECMESFDQKQQNKKIQIVGLNDLSLIETKAHLLKYDSIHGRFPYSIQIENNNLLIIGINQTYRIPCFSESDPRLLPFNNQINLVLECSGHFTTKEKASLHIQNGAQRVLISAPAKASDFTLVYGVNHKNLKEDHRIISNASCTTNCLAPIAFLMEQYIGIESGYMTTIHSVTNDQSLVDANHSDLRRARCATLSMIPTTTGAASQISNIIPSLKGRISGSAIRVPTSNVSIVDFTFKAKRKTSVDEIKGIFMNKREGELFRILTLEDEPLVSSDFNHNPSSAIVDLAQIEVIQGDFCRIFAWYDNEWGFASRMADVTFYIHSRFY